MHVENIFLLGIYDTSNFLSDLGFNVKKNRKKGKLLPTAKNLFQILNLHPKNIYLKKKVPFLMP